MSPQTQQQQESESTAASTEGAHDCEQAIIKEDKAESSSFKSNRTKTTMMADSKKDISSSNIRRKAILGALVMLVLTFAGSIPFLLLAIQAEQTSSEEAFERSAEEFTMLIENTWLDYEYAALSAHNICREERNTTRQEFREFYEYLMAGGLQFESVQCAPIITHDERAKYEAESRAYYAEHYPSINYTGIRGFAWDEEVGEYQLGGPSEEKEKYVIVHYLEPVLPNAPAIELDMYANPPQKSEIDLCVSTGEPVLSGRLQLVQEEVIGLYGVIVYHSGTILERDDPNEKQTVISLIVVKMQKFLNRVAAQHQDANLEVYIYDTTPHNTNGKDAIFLGAAQMTKGNDGSIKLLPEIELEELESRDNSMLYESEVPITPSGQWLILVVPVDDTYEPRVAYIALGGSMIIAFGIICAIWFYNKTVRDAKFNDMRVAAEAERAALIVKSAEDTASAERELK